MRSLANIERIEVLKGPYGALYGPGEPGGAVNFVTKRPEPVAATDIAVGFGSFGEFTAQLDSTGSLVRSAGVDYRFIARREQSDSFRDFAKCDRVFINPMLAWRVNPNLRFDAAFEYVSDQRLIDTEVAAINNNVLLPQSRFLGEPSRSPANADGYTFQLSSEYQMSPKWELDLTLNGQKTLLKGKALELNAFIFEVGRVSLDRSETVRNEQSRVLIAQAEVSGVEVRWDIPHHLLFGFSATGVNEDNVFLASDPDVDPFAIDPFAPSYGSAAPIPELERDSREQTRQFSVYAQDVLRLGAKWRIMLGLRFDHIDQSGSDGATGSRFDRVSDEISLRIGIVYKPTQTWSWFTSYSGSVDQSIDSRRQRCPLAPIITTQKKRTAQTSVMLDVIRHASLWVESAANTAEEFQPDDKDELQ
jgi:iron complex outermembrane receptor protein